MESKFVFHDPTGRRWRRLRRLFHAGAATLTLFVFLVIATVLISPALLRLRVARRRSAGTEEEI